MPNVALTNKSRPTVIHTMDKSESNEKRTVNNQLINDETSSQEMSQIRTE